MSDDIAELKQQVADLTHRLGMVEDVQAIRKLHFAYGYYIDYCMYDEVVQLFADDGEVVFLSGVYKGHKSIARLYKDWFQVLFTEGKPGPVHGFILDHYQMQDIVDVAPDRKTAKARFRALLAGGSHKDRQYRPPNLPDQFWESGVYENDYVRDNGVWKIQRLNYNVDWQANYEEGWAAREAHLQPASVLYPENPLGPDFLIDNVRPAWPGRTAVPFHYPHPVTGQQPVYSKQ